MKRMGNAKLFRDVNHKQKELTGSHHNFYSSISFFLQCFDLKKNQMIVPFVSFNFVVK